LTKEKLSNDKKNVIFITDPFEERNNPFKEGTIWRTDWWEYTGEYYIFSNEHGWVHHIEKEEKGLLTNDIKN
jgi:hypothetical protein